MVAALIVRKPNNSILYDTSKAAYGLIKAGPVVAAGQWNRLDPNKGNKPSYFADDIYKFEVENAVSPIVFVYGKSGKPFQSMEGNKQVFYFAGPVSGIQVYCFDLMRPIFTGPALKTRGEDGGLTFNSLQFPLNVKGTSTPPPVKYFDNGTLWPFTGGTNLRIGQCCQQAVTGQGPEYFQREYAFRLTRQRSMRLIYRGTVV